MSKTQSVVRPAGANRGAYLKRTYGITLEQYEFLLRQQDFVCAVCHKPPKAGKNLCVDHEHQKGGGGPVRGLLCNHCNLRIIGRHKNPEIFREAAKYLSQHTGWFVPLKKKKRKKRKR